MGKKIVGHIKRKPKMFYYVDSKGNIIEMPPKRRKRKR